ncbi:MAG: SDR family oxidoreductase [Methylobacter sp.]|nr:SDR family oxidoreductase [Methylobacter sp.]
MKALITGANGFVGQQLCTELHRQGQTFLAVVRSRNLPVENIEVEAVGAIDGETYWADVLRDVQVVIHLAARVHIMRDTAVDPLHGFRRVNVEGTINLARQAAEAGVRRFIFISSIKVNGEGTLPGRPYTADDQPAPVEPYGISKHEAEDTLRRLACATGMEVVIIRSPLIYGPGVKGNFKKMLRCLDKAVPLPLGAIHNKRSLVALDNLLDLIITCMDHPAAANQTFLAGDGVDLSTTELLRRMAAALDKTAWLLPIPIWVLNRCASLLGKSSVAQRLCGSLQVDINKTRDILGWTPVVSVDEALRRTAQHYKSFCK